MVEWRKGRVVARGARNINFIERFFKPFTRIENPGYENTKSFFLCPFTNSLS